jgi:hypothetical protein
MSDYGGGFRGDDSDSSAEAMDVATAAAVAQECAVCDAVQVAMDGTAYLLLTQGKGRYLAALY